MREIKFRGLGLDGWEYGYVVKEQFTAWNKEHDHNCDNDDFLEHEKVNGCIASYGYKIYRDGHQSSGWVKKDTIGQYIEVLDAKGKKIYEGDILLNQASTNKDKRVVEIKNGKCDATWGCFKTDNQKADEVIVGNIHDNPGLL